MYDVGYQSMVMLTVATIPEHVRRMPPGRWLSMFFAETFTELLSEKDSCRDRRGLSRSEFIRTRNGNGSSNRGSPTSALHIAPTYLYFHFHIPNCR